MNNLPKSFLVFLIFATIGICLVVYFVSKQFLFRRHKRKGEAALQRQDYFAAVESFGRAEALWDFNATKETTPSYLRDLATLDELLTRLEAAARKGVSSWYWLLPGLLAVGLHAGISPSNIPLPGIVPDDLARGGSFVIR